MDFAARALRAVAGIAAAVAMAQFVPRFADVSHVDLLRGLHALIEGWRSLAAWVGTAIGELPLVPPLSDDVVTVVLFAASFAVPVSIMISMAPPPPQLAAYDFLEYQRQVIAHGSAWAPLKRTLTFVGMVFILLSLYVLAAAPDLMAQLSPRTPGRFELISAAASVGVVYLFALAQFRGYFAGLFAILALVVATQALYWLDAPWIADHVRALAGVAAN